MDHLKSDMLVKTTDSGKLFHTLTTLFAKKPALRLSHRYLYSLYKCRLMGATEKIEIVRKSLVLQDRTQFYNNTQVQGVVAPAVQGLEVQSLYDRCLRPRSILVKCLRTFSTFMISCINRGDQITELYSNSDRIICNKCAN